MNFIIVQLIRNLITIFDNKGMLIIPNPQMSIPKVAEKTLVLKE